MSTDGLSVPGSSQYDSNTFYVGDGTWDASRNDFLLPNLVGLNFATMQYNGMGNRFAALPEYHTLIKAHGGIAAVVFLFLIPTAIVVARFYQGSRRRAIHIHVWIQILVVFLLTVVLILGWFAVGPERSLSNPHHGIGVALYTLVLVQVIGGAIVRRRDRYRDRDDISIKVMLHHWFGRAIALLGLAQIPLGLTLYGAAKVFFILYALVAAAWVVLWFILSYRYQSERYLPGECRDSYVSRRSSPRRTEEVVEERRESGGGHFLRNTALIGGGLAGLRALRGRMKRRDSGRVEEVEEEVIPSRPHSRGSRHSRHTSGSYIEDEKLDVEDPGRTHTWRNRLAEAGAGFVAFEGIKRLFNRRRGIDEESDLTSYSRPALSGDGRPSRTDISMVESGQAPYSPADRRRRTDRMDESVYDSPLSTPSRPIRSSGRSRLRPRRSGSFSSVSSIESGANPAIVQETEDHGITKRQGLAATLAGISGIAYLRHKQNQRRERREERRLEEIRRHDEEIADRIDDSQRRRPGFGDSRADEAMEEDDTAMTGSNPNLSRHRLPNINAPPLPPSAAIPHSVTDETHSTTRPTPGYPVDSSSVPIPTGPGPASDARFTEHNTSRVRFQDEVLPAAAAGGAAALAADEIAREKARRNRRPSLVEHASSSFTTDTSVAPPVAVRVKVHDDNKHVTLQRLPESERRRRRRRQRAESLSSGLDSDGQMGGYRRRMRPSAEVPIENIPPVPGSVRTNAVGGQGSPLPSALKPGRPVVPGPPPVPVHGASPYGVGSPGGYETTTGTGTESAFDDNRRRRRAERAARRGGLGGAGPPVGVGIRGDYD